MCHQLERLQYSLVRLSGLANVCLQTNQTRSINTIVFGHCFNLVREKHCFHTLIVEVSFVCNWTMYYSTVTHWPAWVAKTHSSFVPSLTMTMTLERMKLVAKLTSSMHTHIYIQIYINTNHNLSIRAIEFGSSPFSSESENIGVLQLPSTRINYFPYSMSRCGGW